MFRDFGTGTVEKLLEWLVLFFTFNGWHVGNNFKI